MFGNKKGVYFLGYKKGVLRFPLAFKQLQGYKGGARGKTKTFFHIVKALKSNSCIPVISLKESFYFMKS